MSKLPRRAVWPTRTIAALSAAVLLLLPANGAEPEPQEALFQARLEAGDFAPAAAMAREVLEGDKHDEWLARIATTQARVGALDDSLSSAAEIYDDRTRSEALTHVAAETLAGHGGGGLADFDTLMDLITTTIEPDSWEDVGGAGTIAPYPNGVLVDPEGVLRPGLRRDPDRRLAALHASARAKLRHGSARGTSPLRKVSLPRLEEQVRLRTAAGRPPTETMQVLAGLQRIEYIFVYPESGDLVLAGPAGDWIVDAENRVVSVESGQPVVRLDDLIVVFRQAMAGAGFGCLIAPTQEGLARVQAFVEESNKSALPRHERKAWLASLGSELGRQEIQVWGLDPRTRAARVLVEADYRMKLVGMGLEEGVDGVVSYLDLVKVVPLREQPPMDVLRWWFTLNYEAVLASEDRRAFAIRGQGVKVLSENELLTAQGQRIHTGKSDALNRQFAESFTTHFEALCQKYPVYAELRNVCDLALAGALIGRQDLASEAGWEMTCFGDSETLEAARGAAPREVDTVVSHRVVRGVHIMAGVSGGVSVEPASLAGPSAMETERDGVLNGRHSAARLEDLPRSAWWWD